MNLANANKAQAAVVPLFFSVDDLYAPYLAVAIRSVIENAAKDRLYRVHVMCAELSEKHRARLAAMQTENVTVQFVDVREKLSAFAGKLSLRDYYTVTTYYRFFIAAMFPQYDRGVYLDSDVVVNRDVAELFGVDMGDSILAALADETVTANDTFSRYVDTVLSVPPTRYFNAGVLVLNLEKMRRVDLLGAFLSMIHKVQFPVAQDQDYLNVLCYGDVYYADPLWNKVPFPDSPDVLPALIHFKLNFRPWRYRGIRFEEHFWKYAEHTAYFDELVTSRENYSDAEKQRDAEQGAHLLALSVQETEKALLPGYVSPIGYALARRGETSGVR